ncbi:unnamed protein product [Phytophthora lilii]|uniref:Unnamed protein product n=1 Tax=Phytophthora lilii TaxID=2077276 RepID=A0A9W6U063_9STRA|nr:unnamed protein product [Phytophthora lilii]
MVLSVPKITIKAVLVLQLLHGTVHGLKVENFQNTQLTDQDALGTVSSPAKIIPDSIDKKSEKQELFGSGTTESSLDDILGSSSDSGSDGTRLDIFGSRPASS